MRQFALIIFILSAVGCRAKSIALAPEIPGELAIGSIALELSAEKQIMRVIDRRHNRILVRFALSSDLLVARRAVDAVREKFAHYEMHESVRENCSIASVESIVVEAGAFAVRGNLRCNDAAAGYTMRLEPGDGKVQFTVSTAHPGINRILVRFLAEDNEHIFGGGEQFTHLDLRGQRVPMLSQEQGIGRGAQPITFGADLTAGAGGNATTTYAPVPFFFTSAFRSFDAPQPDYQVWNFSGDCYTVEIWASQLEITFAVGSGYQQLVSDYTQRMGRMQPLPDWAMGTILGVQGGREKAEAVLDAALRAGNPVSAIWIQDWVGRRQTSFGSQLWWRWLPDESSYPDFRAWVSRLMARGVRVLGYVNPFLADEGPLFKEARDKGYLVRNREGNPYRIATAGFPAYLVDLSNADARRFLKETIRVHLLQNGLAGYMADFGEWLPWDAVLQSGEPASQWHNRYPVEWARLNREVVHEAGLDGKVMFFMRSGYAGSARYASLFWEGDQMVSFDEYDGLASAVTGLITSGISGMALNHSDIGGYTTINNPLKDYHRSRELFLRWAEFALFTPVFRTHEGNRPEKNYQAYSDERVVSEFATLGRMHLALEPYFKILMQQAKESGMPLARPVFMHYPGDANTFALRHQYLLGRDLMVAPVTEAGAANGRVYLPADTWIDSSTGKRIEGPQWHTFVARPGQPVAFIRGNAPMRDLLLAALRNP